MEEKEEHIVGLVISIIFQAEDGIQDSSTSRELVYKRQPLNSACHTMKKGIE